MISAIIQAGEPTLFLPLYTEPVAPWPKTSLILHIKLALLRISMFVLFPSVGKTGCFYRQGTIKIDVILLRTLEHYFWNVVSPPIVNITEVCEGKRESLSLTTYKRDWNYPNTASCYVHYFFGGRDGRVGHDWPSVHLLAPWNICRFPMYLGVNLTESTPNSHIAVKGLISSKQPQLQSRCRGTINVSFPAANLLILSLWNLIQRKLQKLKHSRTYVVFKSITTG